jgi:hypothetical protein
MLSLSQILYSLCVFFVLLFTLFTTQTEATTMIKQLPLKTKPTTNKNQTNQEKNLHLMQWLWYVGVWLLKKIKFL